MRSRAAAVAIALAAFSAHAEPRVVERIVAVVDGRPVLLSEVEAARRVTGAEETVALEALIDELLMFAEAARLPQAAPSPAEETAARASLAALVQGFEDDEALGRVAVRQATILKYVDLRFRPQVRITEEAVAEAVRERGDGAAGEPARVREELEAEDLDRRIEGWIEDLRAAARIRYNPASGSGPASR